MYVHMYVIYTMDSMTSISFLCLVDLSSCDEGDDENYRDKR